jgi:molecular chaperone GrpE
MSRKKDKEAVEATPESRDGGVADVPTDEETGASQPEEDGKGEKNGGMEPTSEAELEKEVARLSEENENLRNDYLRKTADFENFRKRMFREREEAIKYANSNLLEDLVAIIDDFERAIKSSEETSDFEGFRSGIALIEQQFTGMLERKYGLKRFESLGEPFDPEKHAAIATEHEGDGPQIVSEDYQKGYMLHDRVLRHAKVKVSSVAPEQADEPPAEREEADTKE